VTMRLMRKMKVLFTRRDYRDDLGRHIPVAVTKQQLSICDVRNFLKQMSENNFSLRMTRHDINSIA